MNRIGNIRLESLELENFKNIAHGNLYFNENKKLERGVYDDEDISNLLCIYGQNGSGKTASLNAIRLLQHLLSGTPLLPEHFDYIRFGKESMTIKANFLMEIEEDKYYLEYSVNLASKGISGITKEKLSYSKIDSEDRKTTLFSYEYPEDISKTFLSKLERKESVLYCYTASMETTNRMPNSSPTSSIFNPNLLNLSLNALHVSEEEKTIIYSLHHFAKFRLAIYSINYFENNENLGIRIRVKNENNAGYISACSDIFVPFKPFKLNKDDYVVFEKVIRKINAVIPSIIPGYQITITESYPKNIQSATNGVDFVLMSDRNGIAVPLAYESNGIKKIISLISGMIEAYSNEGHLLVVDELDSGIFEYLLGEIAYAFDNFSRGQLIFTCHNMRVLEKISHKNAFFTTLDPFNAFVKITNVKESNNLRDLYYKYIANGLKGEMKCYDMVDTSKLINSLNMEVDS
ncbi:MAG: ATP-binding protein [Bacilli bacterium]|nr:ATP-binding protein [Bacilli bacterium]